MKGLFEPLRPVDLDELFNDAAWVDVLRKMVSHACIFAWEFRLDQYDDGGNPIRCYRPDVGETTMTVEKRRLEYYAAIRSIPSNFSRPSLLSIPTLDPKSHITRQVQDRVARLAQAANAADEDRTVDDEDEDSNATLQ
jgi:hypothetical protein